MHGASTVSEARTVASRWQFLVLALCGLLGALVLRGRPHGSAAAPRATGQRPAVGGCAVFPDDNAWNVPVDSLPVDAPSADYVASIGAAAGLHPDFGSGTWNGGPIGIPDVVVPEAQELVAVSFYYADESDPGPYPVPTDAPIEGGPASGGDRHVLIVQQGTCRLYELFDAHPQADGSWTAGSGALFDLSSNALRPSGWTSADAAGLPMLPGLVSYDEVAGGQIRHAIRFTAPRTRRAYVWPARHYASSSTSELLPPMGQRFRLRGDFDVTPFASEVQVILRALQTYGMILADNGSAWYLSGLPDERWDNDRLHQLQQVRGSDFEAVDASSLMIDPDSAQAAVSPPPSTPSPTATSSPPASGTPSPSRTPTATPAASATHRPTPGAPPPLLLPWCAANS
jgi:hypothetical protein